MKSTCECGLLLRSRSAGHVCRTAGYDITHCKFVYYVCPLTSVIYISSLLTFIFCLSCLEYFSSSLLFALCSHLVFSRCCISRLSFSFCCLIFFVSTLSEFYFIFYFILLYLFIFKWNCHLNFFITLFHIYCLSIFILFYYLFNFIFKSHMDFILYISLISVNSRYLFRFI